MLLYRCWFLKLIMRGQKQGPDKMHSFELHSTHLSRESCFSVLQCIYSFKITCNAFQLEFTAGNTLHEAKRKKILP